MECPHCTVSMIRFAVPDELRDHVGRESESAGDGGGMAICSRCLRLQPAEPDPAPDWSAIDEAFPTDDAAVPMALALGLLDSLALNRGAVEALLDRVERAGTDPFLLLDRLAAGEVEPEYGLARRRHQLEELLE